MDVAVFSDIHGNAVALDAVIADVRNREIASMVCLGDALQGGAQPREVVERLRELGCPVILGNADDFLLEAEDSAEAVSDAHMQVREWTLGQLGEDGLAFIRTFVPTHEVALDGGRTLLCFHGSPRSFDEVLLPESTDGEVDEALGGSTADVLCGGHTHLQWIRRIGERTFFNPGSVGVAYNRHLTPETFWIYPLAQYAVVHDAGVEFCQVPYDVDVLERATLASGVPFAERQASRYRPRC